MQFSPPGGNGVLFASSDKVQLFPLVSRPIETQPSGFDGERKKERTDMQFSPPGGNGVLFASSTRGSSFLPFSPPSKPS